MRLTCPACGAEMTLDVLLGTEAARDAVMAALALPAPLGKLIVQYLALFRPPKRQLSWERVAGLFAELALPMAHGRIERKGRTWPAPLEYWRAGFEQVLGQRDRLTLPLKSHGYLYEILVGLASKAEAAGETLREQSRVHGHADTRWGAAAIDEILARQMPPHVREQLESIGAKFEKKGGEKAAEEKGGDGDQA